MKKAELKRTVAKYLENGMVGDAIEFLVNNASHGKIGGPLDAYQTVKQYGAKTKECFIVIFLNGAHDVIGHEVVTSGLVNRTIVHPREVFKPAILRDSCAVIVAHNHPSGNLEPSPEDLNITKRLKDAGELLGIPVVDHLILGKKSYVSLVELGQFK